MDDQLLDLHNGFASRDVFAQTMNSQFYAHYHHLPSRMPDFIPDTSTSDSASLIMPLQPLSRPIFPPDNTFSSADWFPMPNPNPYPSHYQAPPTWDATLPPIVSGGNYGVAPVTPPSLSNSAMVSLNTPIQPLSGMPFVFPTLDMHCASSSTDWQFSNPNPIPNLLDSHLYREALPTWPPHNADYGVGLDDGEIPGGRLQGRAPGEGGSGLPHMKGKVKFQPSRRSDN